MKFCEKLNKRTANIFVKVDGRIQRNTAFTLAEVLIAKRGRGKISLLNIFRTSELKAPSSGFQKQCAFTLAEILITLAIIGVVASMTIPTLIINQQKQATAERVKKFYTTINQALSMAKVDYGDFTSWDYTSTTDFYTKYLQPYLNAADETSFAVWGDFDVTNVRIFSLNDGSYVTFTALSNFTYGNGTNPASRLELTLFLKRPPDGIYNPTSLKITHDRFYFLIDSRGRLIPPNLNSSRATNITKCSTNIYNNNGNLDCSALIMKDGWQIADDYPW